MLAFKFGLLAFFTIFCLSSSPFLGNCSRHSIWEVEQDKREFGLPPSASAFGGTDDGNPTQEHAGPSMLKSVEPHRSSLVGLTESASAPKARGGLVGSLECSIQFAGPVSEPPILTVSPTAEPSGPFLAVFRDKDPVARGWIHGFETGVRPGSTTRFGTTGHGEYVTVHPPSGQHVYEILLFDDNYNPGPRLSALIGTPWHNRDRAMGSEGDLLEDVRAGNPGSNPQIIGRCSLVVSHEQVEAM